MATNWQVLEHRVMPKNNANVLDISNLVSDLTPCKLVQIKASIEVEHGLLKLGNLKFYAYLARFQSNKVNECSSLTFLLVHILTCHKL